ncbi:MAG: SEL1-like repeat protein [Planctomycetaceae bacterium]|nr:SEL1-like repeat protein [Planctomycetales bacterium]MCB9924702.1 SEL1-like repeat protein [Planctomycetaceae bacterium]
MRTARIGFGVLLFTFAFVGRSFSAEIKGQVVAVNDSVIEVRVTSDLLPVKGDKLEVYVDIPGVGQATVASGSILKVSDVVVVARIDNATGSVRNGQLVKVESSEPVKRVMPASTAATVGDSVDDWGTFHDPDGDCAIIRGAHRMTIKVPPGRHDLYFDNEDPSERNNAPRVVREVTGDFLAQVKVTADWSLRTPLPNEQNTFAAGLAIVASPQHYVRHERILFRHRQLGTASTFVPSIYDVDGRRRTSLEVATPDYFQGPSTWFRVRRTGQLVYTYISHDGQQWKPAREIITELPEKVQVGIHAINASGSEFTVDFEDYELLDASYARLVRSSHASSRFPAWPSITPDQPWLGISHTMLTAGGKYRYYITGLLDDGPASKAGLKTNDFIVSVNGNRISYVESLGKGLNETVDMFKAGETIQVVLERQGQQYEAQVKLEAIPPDGGNELILSAAEAGEAWAMFEFGQRLATASYEGRETEWPYLSKEYGSTTNGIRWIEKAVEAGNAHAAKHLSYYYQVGERQDAEKYVRFCNRARELSKYEDDDDIYFDVTMGLAASYLGTNFLNKDLLPRDVNRGIALYRDLAEKGSPSAADKLGDMYKNGDGVPKDTKMAMQWYEVAAKAGSTSAQCSVGMMAYFGDGVEQDYPTAFAWLKLAAEGGQFMGMHLLGEMYEYGRGVEEDLDAARKWYQKSVDSSLIGNPASRAAIIRLDQKQSR